MRSSIWPLALAALVAAPCMAQVAAHPAAPPADLAATPLTLPEAIARALAGSRALAAARKEVQATEAAQDQAGHRPNPQFEVQVEGAARATRETTLLLTQPIELGGKRAARLSAAQSAIDIARAQLKAREADVRIATTSAFFGVLVAQERVRLAEETLGIAKASSSAIGKRVSAGKVSPIDETRARVAEASVALEVAQARGELRVALADLAAHLGDGPLQVRQARQVRLVMGATDLPSAPDQTALIRRLSTAPAYRQAQLEADLQTQLAAVARARRTPDLAITVGTKRLEDTGAHQAIVGLSIPLPVFDSGRGAEREALLRADKARDEAAALALRLEGDAVRVLEKLRAAREEAQTLQRDVVPGAQSAFDATSKGFELGKFGFLDVIDAQRTLFQARAQHLRALADAYRAAADLDRLLGPDTP